MNAERDEYREAYRSARDLLRLYSDCLTQPMQDAIFREAVRTATKREQFWFFVGLVCSPALYLFFNSFTNINQISVIAATLASISLAIMYWFLRRNSRIKHIRNAVIHILHRKGIDHADA
ncbi:MAG: hypothetical protein AAGB26_16735 [Planctomycetota bacterium]